MQPLPFSLIVLLAAASSGCLGCGGAGAAADGGADGGVADAAGGGPDAGPLPPATCPDPGHCPAGMPVCGAATDGLCACTGGGSDGGSCGPGRACVSVPNYRDPATGPSTVAVCAEICEATCAAGEGCSGNPGRCACTRDSARQGTTDSCAPNASLKHCGLDYRCGGEFAYCDAPGAAGECKGGLACDGPFGSPPKNYCLKHCSGAADCDATKSCQSPDGVIHICQNTDCPAPFGECSADGTGGQNDGTCVPNPAPPNTCVKDGLAPWFSPCVATSLFAMGAAGRDDPAALCQHGAICVPFVNGAHQRTGLALCLPLCALKGGSPGCPAGSLCRAFESDPNAVAGICSPF